MRSLSSKVSRAALTMISRLSRMKNYLRIGLDCWEYPRLFWMDIPSYQPFQGKVKPGLLNSRKPEKEVKLVSKDDVNNWRVLR